MAYEVTKQVGGRAYRYQVESYRDPETGRVKGRWRYLGRAKGSEQGPQPQNGRETRERLLDAVEQVLERKDHRKLTAGAVSREAGLAYGTFYRHFKDRTDALYQALGRVASEGERLRADFSTELGSINEERARVRSHCEEVLRKPSSHRGLARTWFALTATDARIGGLRREHIERAVLAWSTYIDRLRARGYANCASDSRDVAIALVTLLEASVRRVAVDEDALDEGEIAATVEMMERAIFH